MIGSGPRPRTHLHSCSQTLRALIPLRPDLLRNQPVLRARGLGEFRGLFCSLISASQGLWVSLAGSPHRGSSRNLERSRPVGSWGPATHSEKGRQEAEPLACSRTIPVVAVYHFQTPPRPLLLFFPPLFPEAWNLVTKWGPEGSN